MELTAYCFEQGLAETERFLRIEILIPGVLVISQGVCRTLRFFSWLRRQKNPTRWGESEEIGETQAGNLIFLKFHDAQPYKAALPYYGTSTYHHPEIMYACISSHDLWYGTVGNTFREAVVECRGTKQ